METKDFRKFVNNSPIKDKLNSLELVLNYPIIDSKKELKGLSSIYNFIYKQVIEWNSIENLPEYLNYSKKHFESIKSILIGLVDYINIENQNQFDSKWNNTINTIKIEKIHNNRYYVFLYDCPETDFLIRVNNKNINYTQGAIDFITNTNINFNNNKDYFTGFLLAYEFKNQTDSEIHHRRNNEKKSLGQIRERYNDYIVEAEQQLNGYISDAKDNLSEHFETVNALKEEKNKSFEVWFKDTEDNYDSWIKNTEEEFDNYYENVQSKILENENLYREKLRLEAPAKYWKDRAVKLESESQNYLGILIRISLYGSLLLFILLISLGNNFYQNVFSDNIKGIKWSLILITIISLLVFIIRIFAKLYLSTLHLSRDAEEREQLTHFYLALKKDTTIEPEERQLILQSLFSRADTGLLKDDSSPTMPTHGVFEKFAGKN